VGQLACITQLTGLTALTAIYRPFIDNGNSEVSIVYENSEVEIPLHSTRFLSQLKCLDLTASIYSEALQGLTGTQSTEQLRLKENLNLPDCFDILENSCKPWYSYRDLCQT